MKAKGILLALVIFIFAACGITEKPVSEFAAVSHVDKGTPVSVMMTAYSTTLLADGVDHTRLRGAIADSINREITTASGMVRIYLAGDGSLALPDGTPVDLKMDENGEMS